MLRFDEAVRRVIENYKDFDGRSRRSEFWWFQLALVIATVIVGTIEMAMGVDVETSGLTPLSGIFLIATFLPSAAVTARRLHDVGMTGWAQAPLYATYISFIPGFENFLTRFQSGQEILLGFVFVIYAVWILVHLVRDSQPHTNRYGGAPKDENTAHNFD